MRNSKFTFKEFCWTAAGIACALWAIWALGKEGAAAQQTSAAAGIWAILIWMHIASGDCHTDSMQEQNQGEASSYEAAPTQTTSLTTKTEPVGKNNTLREYGLLG